MAKYTVMYEISQFVSVEVEAENEYDAQKEADKVMECDSSITEPYWTHSVLNNDTDEIMFW